MQNFSEQFDAAKNRFPDRLAVSLRREVGADAAAGLGCVVILVSEATREEGATSALLPPCPATRADLAVIVYAAGMAGDPKRVVLAHEKLLAATDAASSVADMDEHDSTL